jgi:hypothetical protein
MDTPTQIAEDDKGAFCSVLNVVLDYNMEEPTTLEPDEFGIHNSNSNDTAEKGDRKRSPQQVPVIRIFGPVLRQNSINPPIQCRVFVS